jgi:hypothetical protein
MIPNEDEYYMSLALKQAERALEVDTTWSKPLQQNKAWVV